MNYRELQMELKSRGLSAKGKKVDLEARLAVAIANGNEDVAEPTSDDYKDFIFTGDKVGGCDPDYCTVFGYLFKLNGRAVTVKPEIAAKLATHSHFTEK